MKLLILTQVVDRTHPVLGFFHRWIEFFAKECESIEVICLQAGVFDLPPNVTIHSLGKEKGGHRIKYLWLLTCLLWQLRHKYDNVFVHMNQIYVVLAGWYWRLSGKLVGLWYAHGSASMSLRMAAWWAHYIFSSTHFGFPLTGRSINQKVIVTGQGIDIHLFSPQVKAKDIDLLTISRLSPTKDLESVLLVLKKLQTDSVVRLTIIGAAAQRSDQEYVEKLKEQAASLGLVNLIDWEGPVANDKLPDYLQRAKVFVHASRTGSLDKTLLEPLLIGVPVVTLAAGARSLPLGNWQVTEIDEMTQVISGLLQRQPAKKIKQLQDFVINNHSLQNLIPHICCTYKKEQSI